MTKTEVTGNVDQHSSRATVSCLFRVCIICGHAGGSCKVFIVSPTFAGETNVFTCVFHFQSLESMQLLRQKVWTGPLGAAFNVKPFD